MNAKLLKKVRKYYYWNLNVKDSLLSTCALIHKKTKRVTLLRDTDQLMWHIAFLFRQKSKYQAKKERRYNMRLFKKYGNVS
jgi:hypothetical protein